MNVPWPMTFKLVVVVHDPFFLDIYGAYRSKKGTKRGFTLPLLIGIYNFRNFWEVYNFLLKCKLFNEHNNQFYKTIIMVTILLNSCLNWTLNSCLRTNFSILQTIVIVIVLLKSCLSWTLISCSKYRLQHSTNYSNSY